LQENLILPSEPAGREKNIAGFTNTGSRVQKPSCRAQRKYAHLGRWAKPTLRYYPPDEITWREYRTVLDSELGRLPEKWRLPLILCYLEGRSQEEAAKQLGWSKSTLLRRLEEARAALGRRLTRRGVVWPAALSAVLLSDCPAPAALVPFQLATFVSLMFESKGFMATAGFRCIEVHHPQYSLNCETRKFAGKRPPQNVANHLLVFLASN